MQPSLMAEDFVFNPAMHLHVCCKFLTPKRALTVTVWQAGDHTLTSALISQAEVLCVSAPTHVLSPPCPNFRSGYPQRRSRADSDVRSVKLLSRSSGRSRPLQISVVDVVPVPTVRFSVANMEILQPHDEKAELEVAPLAAQSDGIQAIGVGCHTGGDRHRRLRFSLVRLKLRLLLQRHLLGPVRGS
jgi:hypothetical protein